MSAAIPTNVPLDEQIECVRREISMRERIYPRWVASEKLKQHKADREIAAMRAVEATLLRLKVKPLL